MVKNRMSKEHPAVIAPADTAPARRIFVVSLCVGVLN